MIARLRLGLTQRIVGLIVVAIVGGAWLLMKHAEEVLEEALLDGAKRQALVLLAGLEHEAARLPDPNDRAALQRLVESRAGHRLERLDFAILELYIFDAEGVVLAHTRPEKTGVKDIGEYKRRALNEGRVYLGEERESYRDLESGKMGEKLDIVLPADLPGLGRVGLELEIGLEATERLIKLHDDKFETEAARIIGIGALVLLAFIGWVVHRGLIRPINAMDRVTGRIAAGDMAARVDGRLSRDELGRLGGSINHMAESLERLIREQEEAYLQMMQSLAKALETKDSYTAGHSARVARYSVKLARRIGMAETDINVLKRGALMHDLGKIGIPDSILNKPGPLDDAEYEEMQKHPVYTAAIMRPLKRLKAHAEIAAWHHERWDGTGYPDGLAGDEIPLMARIVAIADTWDAMTGDRVYRKGMEVERAASILESERESGQFEPSLLDDFLAMVREEHLAHLQVQEDIALSQSGAQE